MYLIDTNIWLERLLDQDRAHEVGDFLSNITTDNIKITDFAFHSLEMTRVFSHSYSRLRFSYSTTSQLRNSTKSLSDKVVEWQSGKKMSTSQK